jgi:hypothetical protein
VDLLFELLEDPAYRHVLLNHLPVTGLGFAWIMLGWAAFDGRWPTTVFALSLVAIASAAAQPAMQAGNAAYPFVFDTLDGDGQRWLDHHAWLAERWGWLLLTNAALAAGAITLGAFRERTRRAAAGLIFATTLAALGAGALIADAGGKVRHAEFRLEDPPIHEEAGRLPRR